MKKRLIYHLYYSNEYENDIVYDIHFTCLKLYSYHFDDALFVISLDDITEYDAISKLEKKILSLGFKGNLSFKIVKNDSFRETRTFYNEIAAKLNDYEGLTFFGHSKGLSNKGIIPSASEILYDRENIYLWIMCMYFWSLDPIVDDYVDKCFYSDRCITFGNPMIENLATDPKMASSFKTKYRWCYEGTMFWINTKGLSNYLEHHDLNIPLLADRWYSEDFVGNVMPFPYNGSFYKNYGVGIPPLYRNCFNELEMIYGGNMKEFARFLCLYEYVMAHTKLLSEITNEDIINMIIYSHKYEAYSQIDNNSFNMGNIHIFQKETFFPQSKYDLIALNHLESKYVQEAINSLSTSGILIIFNNGEKIDLSLINLNGKNISLIEDRFIIIGESNLSQSLTLNNFIKYIYHDED